MIIDTHRIRAKCYFKPLVVKFPNPFFPMTVFPKRKYSQKPFFPKTTYFQNLLFPKKKVFPKGNFSNIPQVFSCETSSPNSNHASLRQCGITVATRRGAAPSNNPEHSSLTVLFYGTPVSKFNVMAEIVGTTLQIDGFLYYKHSEGKNEKIYWNCQNKAQCSARAITQSTDRAVVVIKGPDKSPHSHAPNREEVKGKKIVERVKRHATQHPDAPPSSSSSDRAAFGATGGPATYS